MNMTILFPVILVVVVGLIFGIILTIAAKFMFVPVDEIVAKVREELPGANCGACGYAGCDDYAGAFGEDKDTPVNKCPVGGPDLAAKIAEILGVEASSGAEPVAVVLCQGTNSVATDMMKYGSNMTCKGASQLFGGSKSCAFGCLGLGDCVSACEFDSIGIVDGIAFVDRETCVGCGACAKACPKSIIDMVTKEDRIIVKCKSKDKGAQVMKSCKTGCIGCKKCETACPFDSIHITDNLAHINYDTCKNCGLCAKACPTHAIHMTPKKKPVVKKPAVKVESSEATA